VTTSLFEQFLVEHAAYGFEFFCHFFDLGLVFFEVHLLDKLDSAFYLIVESLSSSRMTSMNWLSLMKLEFRSFLVVELRRCTRLSVSSASINYILWQ
jgi:hypothetical protein